MGIVCSFNQYREIFSFMRFWSSHYQPKNTHYWVQKKGSNHFTCLDLYTHKTFRSKHENKFPGKKGNRLNGENYFEQFSEYIYWPTEGKWNAIGKFV